MWYKSLENIRVLLPPSIMLHKSEQKRRSDIPYKEVPTILLNSLEKINYSLCDNVFETKFAIP